MDRYLTLSDGTILKNSHALQDRTTLFVYIEDEDVDFVKAYGYLSDPEKVKSIVYHYYKAVLTFEGFTRLTSIADEGGRILAVLRKDVQDAD